MRNTTTVSDRWLPASRNAPVGSMPKLRGVLPRRHVLDVGQAARSSRRSRRPRGCRARGSSRRGTCRTDAPALRRCCSRSHRFARRQRGHRLDLRQRALGSVTGERRHGQIDFVDDIGEAAFRMEGEVSRAGAGFHGRERRIVGHERACRRRRSDRSAPCRGRGRRRTRSDCPDRH